jgi:ankyrin repeat protein
MNGIDEELREAAKENNVPEVGRLLRAGADVNAEGEYGWTPLHWACEEGSGHVQVVKELLEHGADIEAKDNYDRTPLRRACIEGHVQVVKELLEHGADIEAKDNIGWTPLHSTCRLGNLPVFNELLSLNNSNGTATASILGKRKSRGANIEATDRNGHTPLHFAAIKGHVAIAKALLRITESFQFTKQWMKDTQKWPSVYFNISTQQSVISLSTNYWKTSRGLVIPTAVMLRHFVKRFAGVCCVRMTSWRSLSIWSAKTLNCSVLVTETVHYHFT